MSDMNWLSLDDAERIYFATSAEILDLVAEGKIETKTVTIRGHDYLRLLEFHLDRHFERRNPNTKRVDTANATVVATASGAAATGIVETVRWLFGKHPRRSQGPSTGGGSVGGNLYGPAGQGGPGNAVEGIGGPGIGGDPTGDIMGKPTKGNPPGGGGAGETGTLDGTVIRPRLRGSQKTK